MALAFGSIAEMREICISYLINKKIKKSVDKRQQIVYNKDTVKKERL